MGAKSPHILFYFREENCHTHTKRMTIYELASFVNSLSMVETYQLTHFLIPFIVNITSDIFFTEFLPIAIGLVYDRR